MSNNVFANGREISCKKADGKSICCFPDVCFTPPDKVPPTPPGVPIPYPNTGMAKDATSGSKKVKISDQEVILKNKSHFKTSVGDEAGCAQKKGVVTSKNKGKVYFTAWSMDVKVEGENVVRHLDLTTHNHGSSTNTPPWPYKDSSTPKKGPCKGQPKKCKMTPYRPDQCPDGKTGHHAIPVHCYMAPSARSMKMADRNARRYKGAENYRLRQAVVICVDGAGKEKTHGEIHDLFDAMEDDPKRKGVWTAKQAENAAVKSICKVTKCSPKCIRAQIRHNNKKMKIDDKTVLRADSTGKGGMPRKPSLTRKGRPR